MGSMLNKSRVWSLYLFLLPGRANNLSAPPCSDKYGNSYEYMYVYV